MKRIIDLSQYNIVTNMVQAAANCDGVIIRLGIRGYAGGKLKTDKRFAEYVNALISMGKPWGVYFVTQAVSSAEAESEATYCLSILSVLDRKNMLHGVWCDTEYSNSLHTGRADRLSKARRTQYVNAFCQRIRTGGYKAGVYCSESWAKSQLFQNHIAYPFWIAKYGKNNGKENDKPTVTHEMWQYTSVGKIPGIKGNVDISVMMEADTVYKKIDYAPVFDAKYYADKYSDLKAAFGYDAARLLAHFANCGMREHRQACEEFNPVAYRARYKDLQAVFGDDWTAYYLHYIQHGKAEGRNGK